MYDTVIRGGSLFDGTGRSPEVGDIAITDGKIMEVGGKITAPAREVIDADGAIVTPGFIDTHSHYDGQYLWDTELDSSFSSGVTTVISGNCGVGFAPLRPEFRQQLMEIMEGVEDIPVSVLDKGLEWDWQSFPEYFDRIDARHYTMDVAAAITHAPLRIFVMGERAQEEATSEDIAEMARLVRQAMDAGAVGFSAGRILEHRSSIGEYIPGTFSSREELLAIARAMGAGGTGVFQMIPRGASGDIVGTGSTPEERQAEHDLMVELAQASGRPLTYLLFQFQEDPTEWQLMVGATERAVKNQGVNIRPCVSSRQIGLLQSIDGYHIFQCRPSYMKIAHLPRTERVKQMRDPELRRTILSEANVSVDQAPTPNVHYFAERFTRELASFYAFLAPIDYEPDVDSRVDTLAQVSGKTMQEVIYDLLTADEGLGMAAQFAMNYPDGSLSGTYEMLSNPITLASLGDGGAHLLMSCDAAMPTFQLSFWARDRKRGPRFSLENVVHRLTGDAAQLYGFHDRGFLAPGMRADINVIDFDNLGLDMPHMKFDLPAGAGRLVQHSRGYLATMVNGVVTRRNDQDAGARPGRLLRVRAAN